MTDTTNNISYRVVNGPTVAEIERCLPSMHRPNHALLRRFNVEVYNGDTLVRHHDVSCRFEAIAYYKNSTWILFMRVKVGDQTIVESDNHRFMAVAYDIEKRCGPARFACRSLLDLPIIIGSEQAGSFIA